MKKNTIRARIELRIAGKFLHKPEAEHANNDCDFLSDIGKLKRKQCHASRA